MSTSQSTMAPPRKEQPPLLDRILQCGKLAFDPGLPEDARKAHQLDFSGLLDSTGATVLIPVLNLLVQPDRVQPWLRAPLIRALALLPLRPHGVQDTIEFIFSVHPSTKSSNQSDVVGRGARISHDALNSASRLLSSPPNGMMAEEWFAGIAPQLLSLLNDKEPEMVKAASYIIGFGILGRRQYGAPGKPGWNAFAIPILGSINPNLKSQAFSPSVIESEESIPTIRARELLVSSSELSSALSKLTGLLASHPNPSLAKRLLSPIILPLWSLSTFQHESLKDGYSERAKHLLQTLLQLSFTQGPIKPPSPNLDGQAKEDYIATILRNLTFDGDTSPSKICWIYSSDIAGGIRIERRLIKHEEPSADFKMIDDRVSAFGSLLQSTSDIDDRISNLFLSLCTKWLEIDDKRENKIMVTRLELEINKDDITCRLVEAKVLQMMLAEIPEKLVGDSRQVLILINDVLSVPSVDKDLAGSEDIITITLSLLNIVLTSPNFRQSADTQPLLDSIQTSLDLISRRTYLDASGIARNLLLLLRYGNTLEDDANTTPTPTNQQLEDQKSYNLALSYLTATDSPPPVRAQGLELLATLIRSSSSILDIQSLLVLFSSILQDSEEYIYLRVIRCFVELSKRHPKTVMKDLIDRYVDINEDYGLDGRLRSGEALLQVIQNSSSKFTGETSRYVCEGLFSVAGRRGFKPKAKLEQERKQKMRERSDQEAEDAWGGPVPQLDEVLEVESTHDENEILSQIVDGWESRRGTEDIRIRSSALSILGSAIETNLESIGSRLISAAIDLSIHVLTLEPEIEKGILRRSAIILIMSFLRSLDTAKSRGKSLGFGFLGSSIDDMRRILTYVQGTDNDGIVRQHAQDVIEGLETLQMSSFLPSHETTTAEELAGLSIAPAVDISTGRKPVIEEIE
ncbi:hypothetical protein B7494_g3714 [Chlorociboria aeruginascens]|nr:hypothetical protein B7494_g3714 [Chlorociboria aeruginascens]